MSTSEKILKILEENHGGFVSGADISEQLGISRTSIWKAVNKLRSEGYQIKAVTHRGYQLTSAGDVISAAGIDRHLNEAARAFLRPQVFASVGSTNTICLDRAAAGEPGGYAAVAGMQTSGRGRRGRSFYSPADTGLYISLLLRPMGYTADKALRFTTSAAVSVCEAIENVCGYDPVPDDHLSRVSYSGPLLKWGNDIYMRGRKVCGILTEASFKIEDGTLDHAVIGIGINVYTPERGFPEEISEIAGSVIDDYTYGSRNRLAAEVLNGLVRHCVLPNENCTGKSCIDEYRKRCMVLGRGIDVISHSGSRHARALDLDDECRLLVRYEDGSEEYLSSGEISIRGQW
ncbi:MAG: biotin--[Mogibacterium sp.]|nr:biotin--[acetyl-CoA-carboxylase] ligase [Mogibacterium sp.]